MIVRLAAALFVLSVALTTAASAGDNPWSTIKELFREPVAEIKQQFKQLRPPLRANTAAQPKAAVTAPKAEPPAASAAVPIPVARPPSAPLAGSTAEPLPKALRPTLPGNAPPQSGEPVVADELDPPPGILATDADAAPDAGEPTTAAAPPTDAASPTVVPAIDTARDEPMVEPNDAATAKAPIPRPRPEDTIAYAAVGAGRPVSKSQAAIGVLVKPPALKKPAAAAGSTCRAILEGLGVEATPIAPIDEGVCGVPEPVAVAALGDGATDLTAKAIIGCQLAEVFANWLEDAAQPAARRHLDGEIVGLRVAASYACRSRNNVAGARLSEHARGRAIDISAFNVSGRGWIEVGGRNGASAKRFLADVRESACGPFKTVLGPGSDRYHSDHFHFDLAQRALRGKSRGLYCR